MAGDEQLLTDRRPRPGRTRGWLVLLRQLRGYLRPHAAQLGLLVVLLALQAGGILYLPTLNADVINNGVVVGDVGYIWRIGGLMLGIVFAVVLVSLAAVYYASRISMSVGARMRSVAFRRTLAFSATEMNQFGIPSLITRNTNDVQQVQQFLQMALSQLVLAAMIGVGAIILAVLEGHVLSLLLVVAIPATALVITGLLFTLTPLARVVQARLDRLNLVLREQITGVRVIRAFLRTQSEQEKFAEANDGITATSLRSARIFSMTIPVLLGISNLSSVGVLWFGGRLVSEGSIPIGNMSAFLIYIATILMYVVISADAIVLIPRAIAGAERIDQVIKAEPDVTDPPSPVARREATGRVSFRQVSFGYPGGELPVLSDLSFSLEPGLTSAVVGGTGSGKTTLVNLIPRFFDVTSGTVLVNGTDVREQSSEQLWATIGLVPQAAFLFTGSVASNLRLGAPEATDEQLWHALECAQALDFVSSMPGKLDARIDQGGTNLSGGQRQRLAIARALVRRPRIYLFDDCFAALDAATDARLRAALRAEVQDSTVVIVAQRISTIMHADQIIVLDAGRVAGIGTHEQLLDGCGTYREIVASQLAEGAAA
jgi:ABC-type multidrug transport system fused ATPase/permease subunit